MKLRPQSRAFTLVEILVVITIILLVAIVSMPVLSALSGRQVTDAARIFSGSLVGARDSAIRYNQPRGIRLLPDPTLTIPPPGQADSGTIQLVYNRVIPIEPAGDFSQGKVTIGPWLQATATQANFPPVLPYPDMASLAATTYPFYDSSLPSPAKLITKVLMIEESPYVGGYTVAGGQPNSPTNWYWTIRVGDKIKINGTGRSYTIVGPCTINPWASTASGNQGNPELFVNVGMPGTTPPLARNYYTRTPGTPATYVPFGTIRPEFLFLVNGEDDNGNGYTDEGFDGFNNNPIPKPPATPLPTDNIYTDELFEWELEAWKGSLAVTDLNDRPPTPSTNSPSIFWVDQNFGISTQDVGYVIERRPVPSQGAREVALPAGMVIDATTWNSTRERSRIPIQPGSLYCDVMVNPTGLYVPTTQYSSPTSADPLPFLHFWITDRSDVFPRGSVWGMAAGVPNLNPSNTAAQTYYELPLGGDTAGYPPAAALAAPVLKGERRLVTMFAQSGLVVTNTIETIPSASTTTPGEGFNVGNINYPFLKAQQGLRETR